MNLSTTDSRAPIACSPLPAYADCEELGGRLRRPVPIALLVATSDRTGHDPGDEDPAR